MKASTGTSREATAIKKRLAFYNMVPNVVWSLLHLVPLFLFCYNKLPLSVLYVFIAVSLVPLFIPNSGLNKLRVGKSVKVYEKLGVDKVNLLAQNGHFINAMMRKKYPRYKAVAYQRSSINKLVQQTYMNEKFHWVMFVFFSLVIVFAISKSYLAWAALLFVNNLFYNVYPNLLQQYIRLKLVRYQRGNPTPQNVKL